MIYDKNFEPYIGMPIYLDDDLFELTNQGAMPAAPTMPMNPNGGMMPTGPTMPMNPNGGMMPTGPMMPMNPNQGMMPTAPMARGTGRCMPNQCMQDQCNQDQCNQNQCGQNQCMLNQGVMPIEDIMPTEPEQCMMNQGNMPSMDTGNVQNGNMNNDMQMGNTLNDCAAGCPLAMAYVPWQSWETPYEDEVAFEVGTVFPSLNLPFLGGKRK